MTVEMEGQNEFYICRICGKTERKGRLYFTKHKDEKKIKVILACCQVLEKAWAPFSLLN